MKLSSPTWNAWPWDTAHRFLLRDRDAIFGTQFHRNVETMGIAEVLTAPRSPWQNAFVERLIGSIRRESLDHVIVLSECHLKQILPRYFDYYHRWCARMSLEMDTPESRLVQRPACGKVVHNQKSVAYVIIMNGWRHDAVCYEFSGTTGYNGDKHLLVVVLNMSYIKCHVGLRSAVMKLSRAVKPISYLKQHTADAVREVNENSSSIVITQNGEAKAVLVDIVEYEQAQESFAILKMLAQSKDSYHQGKHKPAKKALADVRKHLKDRGY